MSERTILKISGGAVVTAAVAVGLGFAVMVYSSLKQPVTEPSRMAVGMAVISLVVLCFIAVMTVWAKWFFESADQQTTQQPVEERDFKIVLPKSAQPAVHKAVMHEFFADQARSDRVQFVYGLVTALLMAAIAAKLLRRR